MAVVCEKGLKNKNIPINTGMLWFNNSKTFLFVLNLANILLQFLSRSQT